MQKSILSFAFSCLFIFNNAQIEKGTLVPGASINLWGNNTFNSDTAKNKSSYTSQNFGINFSHAKFIKENFVLIAGAGYAYNGYKNNQKNTDSKGYNSSSNYSIISESINFGFQKYKFISHEFAFIYGPSISLNFSESIQKSSSSYYYLNNSTSQNNYITSKQSNYSNSAVVGLNFNAGFLYFLNKNIAFVASLAFFNFNYSISPYLLSKKTYAQSFNFQASPSFNNFGLGVSYFIRPKEKK